jgi:hypothetical protein
MNALGRPSPWAPIALQVKDMWKLFQTTIAALVMASNVHWRWTSNPILAAMVGAMFAWFATNLLTAGLERWDRRRRGQQQAPPEIQSVLRDRWPGEQPPPLRFRD